MMKTYGMNGLLEWHGAVHSNGIKMKVDFTNGTVTAYGVAPATFITKSKLTQAIMENSDEFKSGRIKLISKVELPGEDDEPQLNAKLDVPNSEIRSGALADEAGIVEKVSVSDKAEAVEWLKERYPDKGYTGVKLRSKEAFDAACKECNVVFDIQG